MEIENLAAQVPKEEYENIPDTFIALIKENNENKFVYVKKQGVYRIVQTC